MINEKCAKSYCYEDISLIENYHKAIADLTKMWEIHHRKECDENGRILFTCKQLIEMDLYYNRSASELIFVTRSMHKKLHQELMEKCGKITCEKLTFELRSKGGKIGGKIGGKKNGAINGKKGAIKLSIPILQFSKDGEFIKEWLSASEAGRQLGIPQSSICKCIKGHYKFAGGFIWKYKDQLPYN